MCAVYFFKTRALLSPTDYTDGTIRPLRPVFIAVDRMGGLWGQLPSAGEGGRVGLGGVW